MPTRRTSRRIEAAKASGAAAAGGALCAAATHLAQAGLPASALLAPPPIGLALGAAVGLALYGLARLVDD
jgi:hypothetical protein